MSILYSTLIHNKQKKKLAESNTNKSTFQMQISNLLPKVYDNSVSDRIPFEDYYLTYTRSKEIIYMCISPKKLGEERPRVFIEKIINKLNADTYGNQGFSAYNIGKETILNDKGANLNMVLQSKVGPILDKEIQNFNSGLEGASSDAILRVNKEVTETKKILNDDLKKLAGNINELNQNLLPASNKVKENANAFKKEARELKGTTNCFCKPWVKKMFIIIGIILLLLITYTIVAFVRCSEFNAFCKKESNNTLVNNTNSTIVNDTRNTTIFYE